MFKTTLLFFATALCEIIGCFLPWLWLKRGASALLWRRVVDGVRLSLYDWAGALVALCGMLIIVAGWGRA